MNGKGLAIQLVKVSKWYTVHHEKPTFVERIFNGSDERFRALNDIGLEIHRGEKVGIVGPNGSGKTTLLKIIAGIAMPTNGMVRVGGKIVSLIDLEAGFHPDLTGIENIFLNGVILGMSRKDVGNKLREIIKFADIGNFIDSPLYTYSQGMKLRLGFSVMVNAEPDILILDEGITAGDSEFQGRAQKKLRQFFGMGKTILVVTHWLEFLEKNCERILVMDRGRIIKDGGMKALTYYKKNFS